jgi:hypothetical protein
MQTLRQHKYLFAVAALVLVFAGCKGESPTAPSTTTTPTSTIGGGSTPPATVNINLGVTNATPQVNSTSVITATVTDSSGQPVANGTAVEFDTNLGTFTEGNAQTLIRTTTNGVATVTLTSALAGPATVSAIVANVKKTTTVTFSAIPVTPQPPDTSPSITGINPNFGRPQGGEVVTITGKNLRTPLRVLFDFGAGTTPKEATIISSTSTSIQVLTPSVDLGSGQQLTATVKVINEAGSPNEVTATGPTFTYQATVLTPKITILTPSSGPIDGGTRVVIYGEGFQSPVRVQFGFLNGNTWQDVQVLNVLFNQITIITPRATDVQPNGSGTLTGPVDIRVTNITSATQVTLGNVFRYTAKMVITAISPTFGTALGGTQLRIEGQGFNDPLTVDIGSVRARVISVSGSEVVVSTGAVPIPCAGDIGNLAITVTNVDNGDTAISAPPQLFSYVAVNPSIVSVGPGSVQVGSAVQVQVNNPGVGPLGTGLIQLSINGTSIGTSPNTISTGTGTQTFTGTVPLNFPLPTVACVSGTLQGTQFGSLIVPITFTNATTGCTASLSNAFTITPPTSNPCVVAPPVAAVTQPPNGTCLAQTSPTATPAAGTITIANQGAVGASQPLNISNGQVTGPNAGDYTLAPMSASNVAAGTSQNFTVTFTPSAVGPRTATVTFTTNDPAHPVLTINLCGTGTP